MSIETHISRLEQIAAVNDDDFYYRIHIEPTRNGLKFRFECVEQVDRHIFIDGSGPTPNLAVQAAMDTLDEVMKTWGYKE